ncbi:hypothetical protein CEXT_177111 [Caerostris extrusa]|uniref:Uncharacterized protein n=1 Tax=Caerostris extrusa TaxID=172846 RepID=A0AAV4R7Z0_CAEEX|nr:hypothetical protein CEXT_177111 [Caerostris extrusa]
MYFAIRPFYERMQMRCYFYYTPRRGAPSLKEEGSLFGIVYFMSGRGGGFRIEFCSENEFFHSPLRNGQDKLIKNRIRKLNEAQSSEKSLGNFIFAYAEKQIHFNLITRSENDALRDSPVLQKNANALLLSHPKDEVFRLLKDRFSESNILCPGGGFRILPSSPEVFSIEFN